jgi:hypothetical protein
MSRAKRELEALWRAVFNEPPVIDAEPSLMAEMIIRCSGPPAPYGPPAASDLKDVSPLGDRSAGCGP